ncbi:MAG: extracellular solute-binding protein [Alkalicoccus sp.]|nr:MAG: extracellular solute-binding protein [Alkalicoccus sp.]
MKKSIGLVSLTGIALALTACSSNDSAGGSANNDTNADNTENDSGEDVTLTVWAMGEEGEALHSFGERFEEENPNIELDVQAIPWDNAHDNLLTAVASGEGPDVVQLGTTWVAEFSEAGAFLDLSDYTDDFDMIGNEDFFEGALDTTEVEDEILGVPWYVDTRVLFYRSDILAEHGFDSAPSNWEELKEIAHVLNDRGDGMYGFDIDQNDQLVPSIFAWQNGWEYDIDAGAENFADDSFREAMEYYHSFFDEELVQESEGVPIEQGFEEGTKPMFMSGPWMVNIINETTEGIDGDWGVTVLPGQEKNASAIGGSHLSVFAHTDHVEESLEFLSFMSEPDTQTAWFEETNALPARQSSWDNDVLAEDEKLAVFGDQLEEAVAPPVIPEWENVAQELLSSLERVNRGNAEVEEEMGNFQQNAERRLN